MFLRDGIWYVVCTSICAGHVAQYWYGSCLLGNGKIGALRECVRSLIEIDSINLLESIERLNNLKISSHHICQSITSNKSSKIFTVKCSKFPNTSAPHKKNSTEENLLAKLFSFPPHTSRSEINIASLINFSFVELSRIFRERESSGLLRKRRM